MELEALQSISRISKRVLRVLGQNPGKFTLQGTNTYIVGTDRPYILIDTGEGVDSYIGVLEQSLNDLGPIKDQPDVSDIILTHRHHDHVGGIPTVLELLHKRWSDASSAPYHGPKIHKFPLEGEDDVNDTNTILDDIPKEHFVASPEKSQLFPLTDGQSFRSSGLKIIHSPGHTKDSIALVFEEDNSIFTADTVLGQGTAVFEDLASYMSSLENLLKDSDGKRLYPGHGPVVEAGSKLIATYIQHRTERENQILALLDDNEQWPIMKIVQVLYKDYPESLHLPAAGSILKHLNKLEKEQRVRNFGGEGIDTEWKKI